MSEKIACPCCGQPTEIAPAVLREVLTRVQRLIFDAVRTRPDGIYIAELHERVYTDPSGGPDTKTLHVIICQANKRLKPLGWRIKSSMAGADSRYKLIKIGEPPAPDVVDWRPIGQVIYPVGEKW